MPSPLYTPRRFVLADKSLSICDSVQSCRLRGSRGHTATLEVVDDEALFRMGDHVAYAKAEQIRRPKNLVSLTLGTTWHEIKRVRIWHAEPNPEWATTKADVLKSRKPFDFVLNSYQQE